jgi:hypothetical protein
MEKKRRTKKDSPITKKDLVDIDKMLDNLDATPTISTRKKKATGNPLTVAQKKHNYKAISAILAEYLEGYVLIGYDLNEEPMVVIKSISPMQNKAVMGLLEDVANQLLWPDMPHGFSGD